MLTAQGRTRTCSACCQRRPIATARSARAHLTRAQAAAVAQNEVEAPAAKGKKTPKANDVEKLPEETFEDAYNIATLSTNQVQELIKVVSEETDLAEVHVKLADLEVRFRRSASNMPAPAAPPQPVGAAAPPAPEPAQAPAPQQMSRDEGSEDYDDSVDLATVPVVAKKAVMDGTIVNILAEEGDPVEFDQVVFEMQPGMASSGSRIR